MSFELLFDPLFRVPFATGLLLAGILPLIGMYLRLRNEWLAALAFAQMASAGALVAMVLDGPMLAGGVLAALLAALVKGLLARAADLGQHQLTRIAVDLLVGETNGRGGGGRLDHAPCLAQSNTAVRPEPAGPLRRRPEAPRPGPG